MSDGRFIVDVPEDDDNIIVTGTREISQNIINKVLSSYSGDYSMHSKNLNEEAYFKTELTEENLSRLAFNAQSDIEKIKQINTYVDYYLNKNDVIGKTYEIIEANTNASYELIYPKVEGRNIETALDRAKAKIKEFNEMIDIESLIIESIPYSYSKGNRILYLRSDFDHHYTVDKYPLGVAKITPFNTNGDPNVVFDIGELLSSMNGVNSLSGSYYVTDEFYKSVDDEIRANYPKEVYAEYTRSKTGLARLDINNTGVIRVNNRSKPYGLTPIFKSLDPALKLEIQERSDSINSKARGKKIIFQEINEKLLGEDGKDVDLSLAIYSHEELLKAWANEVVIYTGAPWVKGVKYVEPNVDNTQTSNMDYYRSKVLSALGIAFLNGDSKTGMVTAQINLDELMKIIDKISKQLEKIINKWYKVYCKNEGIDLRYAPKIKILDAELMQNEIRLKLAELLFNSFGASYKTIYSMLGIDYETEKDNRTKENNDKMDEKTFYPRMTANTYSAKNKDDYANESSKGEDNKNKDAKSKESQANKEKTDAQ